MGILAYTSATTTANNGATIVSKASFSTNTSIWGTPASPADMSDGSTSNLYFKSAVIAGVTNDTIVNALQARVGYSADATPDPYWIDLIIEVAYTASGTTAYTMTCTTASFTLTRNNANLKIDRKLAATKATFTLTGNNAGLKYGYRLTATTVSFTLTGVNSNLKIDRKMAASVGTFTLTGNNAGLRKGYLLTGTTGSFTLTGVNTNLKADRRLALSPGTFTLTGNNANLLKGFTMAAQSGTFSLTGNNANLKLDRRLALSPGSFALTGNDVGLRKGYVLTATPAGYVLTGNNAGLRYDRRLNASTGSFILTGYDANLYIRHVFHAGEIWIRFFYPDYAQVAYYGLAFDVFHTVSVFIPQLTLAFAPFMVTLLARGETKILIQWTEQLIKWLTAAGVIVFFSVLLLGKDLVPWVLGAAYQPVMTNLLILFITLWIQVLVNVASLLTVVYNRPKIAVMASGVRLVGMLIFGPFLITRWGSLGGCLAVLAASLI